MTDRSRESRGDEWAKNPNVRLDPDSIAKSYQYLVSQDSSALTWEIDRKPLSILRFLCLIIPILVRPAYEKW